MSQLTLLIGRKGSGKSTTFCGMAQALTRPSVIIDPGQAKVYSEAGIGFIKPEEIRFLRGTQDRADLQHHQQKATGCAAFWI